MDTATLYVDAVHFAYPGGPDVLSDISFAVPPGQFLSLVGPNGSGKSTLFRLLCGDRRPGQGSVRYDGSEVHTLPPRKRAQVFSVLAQGEKQDFPFTVLEMVLFGLHPHRGQFDQIRPPQLAQVEEVMEALDILSLADTLVTQISGGESQRVLLARAVVQKPRLLFLDEAMSELDIRARIQLTQYLKALTRQEGIAVIAINHDISAAAQHSDRILALQNGRIVADGAAEQVCTESFFRDVFGVKARIFPDGEFLIQDTV